MKGTQRGCEHCHSLQQCVPLLLQNSPVKRIYYFALELPVINKVILFVSAKNFITKVCTVCTDDTFERYSVYVRSTAMFVTDVLQQHTTAQASLQQLITHCHQNSLTFSACPSCYLAAPQSPIATGLQHFLTNN
jgi:hypothetical protein